MTFRIRLSQKLLSLLLTILMLVGITPTIQAQEPLIISDLDLWQSTDASIWETIPGSYAEGFSMPLDPAVAFYYLDTNTIVSSAPLKDGYYPFNVSSYPSGYFAYWDSRGVNDTATGWQALMWDIINGNEPIFYLKVTDTDYMLVDGLQYALGQGDQPLRIEGSYLLGDYIFSGTLEDTSNETADVDVAIRFVPDLDLLESEDLAEWTSIDGSFAEGFMMEIDPANEYEYLDIEDPTVAYAFTDGYHGFYVTSYPAGYFDYWDSRGVNASASGWQGIMWQIINGDEPIFYLKIDELDYMLVDGLQYALYAEDHPLRINGDYLPGLYTFTGSIANDYGDNTELIAEILFNDIPVAEDQLVETVQDEAVDITLTAINGYGALEWHLVDLPLNGNLTGTAPNLTYTPGAGFNGLDSFTFYVMDELGATSNTATIDIKILGVDCLSINPGSFDHQQAPDSIQTLTLSITNSCQSEADFSLIQSMLFVEEGFEGGIMPPSGGWEIFHRGTTSQQWRVDSNPTIVYEGVYAATIYYDDNFQQDEWLVTPLLDKTGLTDLVLSFMAKSDTNWPGATVKVWVLDNTDTPLTNEPLWDLIRDEDWVDFNYHPVTVDLSAFDAVGQIRIAWQYVGMEGQSFNLDQIKLENEMDVPWLTLNPIDGVIPGESTQNVTLTFDTTGMATGDYEALLYLRNPTQQPLPIPVLLDVKHLNYFPLLLN